MKENSSNNQAERVPYSFRRRKLSNPGMDRSTWERLKSKWSDLDKNGHDVRVEFRLVADPKDKRNVLTIDVIQFIDDEILTETVQKNAGEANRTLGIDSLSKERLIEVYKGMMRELYEQTEQKDVDLIVSMSPSSPASGEIRGYTEKRDTHEKNSVPVNYQHYYLLNAIREKMIESTGDSWSKVRAVYRSGELEFYFE